MAPRSKTLRRKTARINASPKPLDEAWAMALLGSIKAELGEADFVTRDDLLYTRAFSHVATQTRYRYVCESVHILIRKGLLLALNRTDLCLPNRQSRYTGDDLTERYRRTVQRLAQAQDATFGVIDVVTQWKTDPHLTVNTKRAATRSILSRLRRDGLLVTTGPQTYRNKES